MHGQAYCNHAKVMHYIYYFIRAAYFSGVSMHSFGFSPYAYEGSLVMAIPTGRKNRFFYDEVQLSRASRGRPVLI